MSVEIYDNLDPKIAQHIDARLKTVPSVANLPDPNVISNFLYEGAIAYVGGSVKAHYKCVWNSGNTALEWVSYNLDALVIGAINITPGTTVLNLSSVNPSISNCYAVEVNIVGGASATIQSIVGIPGSDTLITFYVKQGQQLVFKHTNYDTASTDQIVLENGFDMTLKGRLIGNESLTLKKHGIANCQWDATQFVKSTEWIQNLLSQNVIDNLTTQNANLPLSANQGYVLNQALNTKQQLLAAGNNIQLVPGVNDTTVNVIPKDWVHVVIPASPAYNATTLLFIASQFPNPAATLTYRYTDLRQLPIQAGGNRGLWLLPPGKAGNVQANWVNLEAATPNTWSGMFEYVAQPAISTTVIANRYYPRIASVTGIGGAQLNFNSDGPPNEHVSTNFLQPRSLYEVAFEIVLTIQDATTRQFFAELWVTNGLQSASNPILTGTLKRTVPGLETGSTASGRQIMFIGTYLISTPIFVGTDNTFTVAIREQSNNFANVALAATNSLVHIKKLA